MNEDQLIEKLHENGISFSISVSMPHGSSRIDLDKSLVMEYLTDRYSALAKYYGVSKSNYLSWLEQEMCVQCSATTGKGMRCKKVVTNGHNVPVQEWVNMQGLICEIHEEKSK
ncbi:hypothetical protein [Acinetobacter beijerinckii]|uniref:hypothetical protein n=1 Tax=Acinetobacter beijerinckii TaxID=262668 RepID=UPI003AF80259